MMKTISWRSILLGLLLGLFISIATYYNDFVINGASLINHLLPISVLGFGLFLLMLVNPLLVRIRKNLALQGSELAVIILIGLAACTWPGAGFFRTAPSVLVMPHHWAKTANAWQTTGAMSYVPGASPQVAVGQVRDWRTFVDELTNPQTREDSAFLASMWSSMDELDRTLFENQAAKPTGEPLEVQRLVRALNRALAATPLEADVADDQPSGHVAENRARLVEALPGLVAPTPTGTGILFEPTGADQLNQLVSGETGHQTAALSDIPWVQWWPTIQLWWFAAIALGLASLCMALIVHPQWSRRELLAYPIPRFVNEMLRRDEGASLPRVTTDKLFWIGFGAIFLFHLYGGIQAYFPALPFIPRYFLLQPLKVLFPTASQINDSGAYFWPWFYFTVIAFSFFLNRAVSFSLGTATLFWVILGSTMLTMGIPLDNEYLGAGKGNMLRFGAWIGMAIMIGYAGRKYYMQVIRAAIGMARGDLIQTYHVWSARLLVVFVILSILLLVGGGIPWVLATLTVLLILLVFLVVARITAETGMFMVQPYWMPVGVLTALLGFEAIGPVGFITIAMASVVLTGDTRTVLMANLVNGLKILDDSTNDRTAPARMTPWLVLMIVGGFFVAGVTTLWVVQQYGLMNTDGFTRKMLPSMPFDALTRYLSDAQALGTISQATFSQGMQRLALIQPTDIALPWMIAGLVLVLTVAIARLRIPWWPIHPVLFLVWGTYPANRFAASFLVGWALKSAVLGLSGAKGYQRLVPMMVGVIAAEVAVSFVWLAVGFIYYMLTGTAAPRYSVI